MRWRFVDRITSYAPWERISGRKVVSLEEYDLLARLGRQAVLPESLLTESAVQLARWLVMKSSDFQMACDLSDLERFEYRRECAMGDVLDLAMHVSHRDDAGMTFSCIVKAGRDEVSAGSIKMNLLPIHGLFLPDAVRTMWGELYAAA